MIIDTLQIKCFLAVAKYLNFTKAANELYLSQPAISRRVATLENELGIVLIDRSNRDLKLTKEGEEFQKFFSKYIQQLEEISLKTKNKKSMESGEIYIGIFEGWNLSTFLRLLLKEIRVQYENINISIETGREAYLIRGLKTEKFDAIILLKITIDYALECGQINDVLIYDFINIKKNIIYSVHNHLAQKENLSLNDFENQTLYGFKNKLMPLHIITNELLFKNHGFCPKVKLLSSLDSVISAVSTGEGYAILDNLVRVKSDSEFNYFELDEYHTVCIVMLKESSNKINKIFLEYCKNLNLEDL